MYQVMIPELDLLQLLLSMNMLPMVPQLLVIHHLQLPMLDLLQFMQLLTMLLQWQLHTMLLLQFMLSDTQLFSVDK